MSAQEQAILQALLELERTANSLPTTQPKPSLLPLFVRLDELALGLPADTAPQLLHYLRKKSYEKARLWLENRHAQISTGGCLGD